jgi:hypothetical protein
MLKYNISVYVYCACGWAAPPSEEFYRKFMGLRNRKAAKAQEKAPTAIKQSCSFYK